MIDGMTSDGLIVARKYGTDVRFWGTVQEDGSGSVNAMQCRLFGHDRDGAGECRACGAPRDAVHPPV